MNSINFEEDQREDLNSVNDAKSLSDQVIKLKKLEDEVEEKEKELKELKRHVDLISGEVIPTMMQEMNISTLKLADGSSVEVKPVYGASITVANKEAAFKWLRDNGQKLKVEPMTLKALVRERLESGQEMPSDLFNVFTGNRTKVTRSK
jgi:predicted nuclease with TOPRIM domain